MNRKFIVFWMIVVFCFICNLNSAFALEPGDSAPMLDMASWVNGTPVKLDGKNIYVICFWATWNEASPHLMDFLNRETLTYKNDATFVAITKENKYQVDRFLKNYPDRIFSIGLDNKSKTYDTYMQNAQDIPIFFIIGKNGDLIWKGTPFEIDRVLSRVVAGTFDLEKQKQIELLRDEIRRTAQFMDFKQELSYAKKILKIDSTDLIAANTVVDHYLRENNIDQALGFLKETIIKAGANKYLLRDLYFSELSIVRGIMSSKGKILLANLVDNYLETFKNDPDSLNSFVVSILEGVPLPLVQLEEVAKMVKQAVDLQKQWNNNPELLGTYLQSYARVYYLSGNLDKAVSTQQEVLKLLKDKRQIEVANLFLEYYENVRTLNKKL